MTLLRRRDALGMGMGVGIGVILMLAGCVRARDAGRLTWWAMSQEGENAPLLIPAFTRDTGIGVDVQALPWTAAHEKLLTAFAGNSLPDVMMVKNNWLAELALVGALAPVPPGSPLLTGQFPGALAAVHVGGRAVAVPWVVDSWMQFYRRDLLAEVGYVAPPSDWTDWKRMAHAIVRRHPDRFATLHLLDWPEPLMTFAAQTGEPVLRDRDARGNFTSPAFREALGFYRSIYDERLSPAVVGAEAGDTLIAFRGGLFAILPANAETAGDLKRRSVQLPANRWSVAMTPGPSGPARGMANGYSLAVSRTARDPIRAWRLVEYLCDARTQQRLHGITGDLPARIGAWSTPALADDPLATQFARQIADSTPPPAIPEWERIATEAQTVAEAMVRGQWSVDAAAAEIDRRVDRILEKRRWLLDHGRIA